MRLFKELSFIDLLPPAGTLIVDCGCRDGRSSKPFYDAGYPVWGIDKGDEFLVEARQAMPNATFVAGDIRTTDLPKGFLIFQNVLPFMSSKEEAQNLIKKYLANSMFFTLFGPEDGFAATRLTWTRDEVDVFMKEIGNVVSFSERKGLGKNLKGEKKQNHIFEVLRIV